MAFENNRYLIILASEIDKCDFSELVTTSENTLRFSIDGNLTFIEWKDVIPRCVNDLTYSEGPYTQQEMLEVLTGEIWTKKEIMDENTN